MSGPIIYIDIEKVKEQGSAMINFAGDIDQSASANVKRFDLTQTQTGNDGLQVSVSDFNARWLAYLLEEVQAINEMGRAITQAAVVFADADGQVAALYQAPPEI